MRFFRQYLPHHGLAESHSANLPVLAAPYRKTAWPVFTARSTTADDSSNVKFNAIRSHKLLTEEIRDFEVINALAAAQQASK